jgi:hypothetical protein
MENIKKLVLNIPESTIGDYIKSGKLYKSIYYLYNVNSKSNHYLNNRLHGPKSNGETPLLGRGNSVFKSQWSE